MHIASGGLPGLALIELKRFEDARGWFMESFNQRRFDEVLGSIGLSAPPFVQDNQSLSAAGVVRGLHYQLPPHAQGKLIRVVRGAAYDVTVDIREGSPTFGKWFGVELSDRTPTMLWIPSGFAHGFMALTDGTELFYKTTDYYDPLSERSICWDDPVIGIDWPHQDKVIVSSKDQAAPRLAEAELFGALS